MRIKSLLNSVLFLALVVATAAFLPKSTSFSFISSASAAVVNSIDVRGNQRIDDEVVISYITIAPGESFNDFDIDDSVKALFRTGLFSDVSIFRKDVCLLSMSMRTQQSTKCSSRVTIALRTSNF